MFDRELVEIKHYNYTRAYFLSLINFNCCMRLEMFLLTFIDQYSDIFIRTTVWHAYTDVQTRVSYTHGCIVKTKLLRKNKIIS